MRSITPLIWGYNSYSNNCACTGHCTNPGIRYRQNTHVSVRKTIHVSGSTQFNFQAAVGKTEQVEVSFLSGHSCNRLRFDWRGPQYCSV